MMGTSGETIICPGALVIPVAAVPPTAIYQGTMYYDTSFNVLRVWYGSDWN
jgi:hypothetical protein